MSWKTSHYRDAEYPTLHYFYGANAETEARTHLAALLEAQAKGNVKAARLYEWTQGEWDPR